MNSLWGAGSFGPNRPEANNNLNNVYENHKKYIFTV